MSIGLDNFHSRYVYRVLRPDEDPHENLTCKDFNSIRSIAQHVQTGLRIPSQYISTTRSFEKAKLWLETADEKTYQKYRNKRTTIVKIDVSKIKSKYPQIAKSAIDLTRVINRNHFLENDSQIRFAGAYEEVVFVHYIPSEVVTVEYTKGSYGSQESLISPPPQYAPLHTNFGIHNSVNVPPVSYSSLLQQSLDSDTYSYPRARNTTLYSNRSNSPLSYPNHTKDDYSVLTGICITGCCITGCCILGLILVALVPCSPVITCCCVAMCCLGICTSDRDRRRSF